MNQKQIHGSLLKSFPPLVVVLSLRVPGELCTAPQGKSSHEAWPWILKTFFDSRCFPLLQYLFLIFFILYVLQSHYYNNFLDIDGQ